MNKQKTTDTDGTQKSSKPEKIDSLRRVKSCTAAIQNIPLPPVPVRLPKLSTNVPSNAPKEDDKEVVYETALSPTIQEVSPNEDGKEVVYETALSPTIPVVSHNDDGKEVVYETAISPNIPQTFPKEDDKEIAYEYMLSTNIPLTSPNEDNNESVYEDTLSTLSNIPKSVPDKDDREAIYDAISRYPQDLSSLSVAEVSRLLKYLEMKGNVERFEKEMIDGSMLITMDKESLQSLEVDTFHCNKLLRFIGGWRPKLGK